MFIIYYGDFPQSKIDEFLRESDSFDMNIEQLEGNICKCT